ncbi:hypothetical protein GALMADRAFT_151991 [Galerina marginata CBS 339.88]|uniref:Uncharacterized protein n=1 Tax=Galerina marginata (strain CBS 339.88) TaxID=685588 RepID=A0A067TIH2_GALM3|nr:hypothetical protein GALMADRAFT_151991 [Galerina marginata CBS 339.88]
MSVCTKYPVVRICRIYEGLSVSVHIKEGNANTLPTHTLCIRVVFPPSCGLLIYFWTSLTVVLARFAGHHYDPDAPNWPHRVRTSRIFWQPRPFLVKLLLADNPVNEKVASRTGGGATSILSI